MNNFKRGGGFGGKSFVKKDFGEKVMHRATCSECGNSCEVPFKPNGKKPVMCSNCFRKDDQGGDRFNDRPSYRPQERSYDRPQERSYDRPNSRSNDRQNQYSEKPSFSAICSDCGNKCDVPFRPTQGKPVLCRSCFGGNESRPQKRERAEIDQFTQLNTKLDQILKLLAVHTSTPKNVLEKTFIKEVKIDEEIEKDVSKPKKVKKVKVVESTEEEKPKKAKKAFAKLKYD